MTKSKRGLVLLIAGVVLILGGSILAVASFAPMAKQMRTVATVQSPGEIELRVPEAGVYTLWHDHRTSFAGNPVHNSRQVPSDFTYQLQHESDGSEVILQASNVTETVDFPSRQAVAVGRFEVPARGTYLLRIENPDGDQRVFSVTEGSFFESMFRFATLLLLGGVLGLGGLAMAIVGIVFLASSSKPPYRPPAPPTPTA